MPDGQVVGVVSTYTDVTVLHQLQQEREDMLHTISHDLRTPLAIIQGHAQELRDQHLADEAVESVNAILRSTQRLNVMIQDLVDAARVEQQGLHLSCEPVELRTFLDDLLARARTVLEVNRINLEIQPNLPAVSADFSRLERIMLNLLSNALKYSPENSPVTVSADMRNQQVVIAITDHGQGIPSEDLPHIFDRFYRSKRGSQVEGMGLGLYITRLLVEAHGGHIWVESKPGVGSTFSFSLPVAKR
jgi:signal transduction histidine kinase